MGQFFLKLPRNFAIFLVLAAGINQVASAEVIGEVTNKAGGKTVITDEDCPVSEAFFYGVAYTKDKDTPMSFCWGLKGDDVIIYFPLNKQISIPIKQFKEPNGKTRA